MSLGINDALVSQAWDDYNGGYGAQDNAIFIQATVHGEHGDRFQDQFAYLPMRARTPMFSLPSRLRCRSDSPESAFSPDAG